MYEILGSSTTVALETLNKALSTTRLTVLSDGRLCGQ